jgi:uncharacterized protein
MQPETRAMPTSSRFCPSPTPETQHFWNGTRAEKLILQRCQRCDHVYFPPRPFCSVCNSREVGQFEASGRARLHSYVISHRAAPGFTAPYAIAVVELREGPKMMTNIVNCPLTPEALILDMTLRVTFRSISETISLPLFEPEDSRP